jgi:cytochrome d ubiquinol oxidase subunit I
MDALELARWQFGITTVYHFLFVPITLGLGFLVAGLQTAWYRTDDDKYLRATKFFGKLFLINFAMGVVTGIVQEFQFGMNWSTYSRFVGDIFGAPLAIEGLLAFFLESTFLGAWIFGWDKLPKKMHLATIWLAAFGTMLSAYFILAANSFMQHPVGYIYNAETGRAELTDIVAVLTQITATTAFLHTMTSAFLVSGAFMGGIAAWLLMKNRDVAVARTTLKLGMITTLVSAVLVFITGDMQSRVMVEQQPMKMAAAEALYETTDHAPFSIFTVGTLDGSKPIFQLEIPNVLSFMSTGSADGTVEGINDLQAQYEEQFGPGDYKPIIPIAYWTFRFMIGLGALAGLYAVWALWATRKGATPKSKWFVRGAIAMPFLPLFGISAGWIFTEMARQPWIVFGLMQTRDGVSVAASAGEVLTSLIVLTGLYAVLAVIELKLLFKAIKLGPPQDVVVHHNASPENERVLTFSY